MKKRIAMSVMTIALAAALICGSTMSLFTSQAAIGTILHAGTVQINVNEKKQEGCIITPTKLDIARECWNPGDETAYPITINNTGSKSVFVRFKVNCTWLTDNKDKNGNYIPDDKLNKLDKDNKYVSVKLDNTCGWSPLDSNGYYTYWTPFNGSYETEQFGVVYDKNTKAASIDVTPVISLSKSTPNDFQDKKLQVTVTVESVQYRNNHDCFNKAESWKEN